MPEFAQIMHFCRTFEAALQLPPFKRPELEEALLNPIQDNGFGAPNSLLLALHSKLGPSNGSPKAAVQVAMSWEHNLRKILAEKICDVFEEVLHVAASAPDPPFALTTVGGSGTT